MAIAAICVASALGSLQGDGEASDVVQRPYRETPSPSFGDEVGTVEFAEFLEGEVTVFGTVHVGPPVVIENANEMHAAGDRVVPVSLAYTVLRGAQFVAGGEGLYYWPAASSEPFLVSKTTANLFFELAIFPRGELTWEQLDHEADLVVSVTGALVSSED